jgi:K+-sensing histidine kinase KdpD
VDQARKLLLEMLGHDMRSPLQTIQTTASYLFALNAGERGRSAAGRLIRSGARMQAPDQIEQYGADLLGIRDVLRPLETLRPEGTDFLQDS